MSTLLEKIGWGGGKTSVGTDTELPEIFPLSIYKDDFVRIDLETIYTRILTDVIERTHGLPEKVEPLLFDNCLAGEQDFGIVSMLAKAMSTKGELLAIYDSATDVIRKPDSAESQQIKEAYKKGEDRPKGSLYVSFSNYKRTDMIQLYSAFEYLAIAGLHKNMNLSNAVQLKIDQLRASVGNVDASEVIAQAKAIAESLNKGRAVMIDSKDILDMLKPDITATNSATDFIDRKRSFYLGLPSSWITGLGKTGLGDTGEADARAIERGLKGFFFSIVRPVFKALFDVDTTFKSDDFRQIGSALEAIKTFEVVSDEMLDLAEKRMIVAKLLGLGERPEPKTDEETAPPVQALNGAQVTSLVQIIEKVALNQIPRESAIQMIMVSFNVDNKRATDILSNAGNGFTPTVETGGNNANP